MAYNFIGCDREQSYLLPPSIKDWLPEDHLAWFILDVVGEMDLSGFYARRREDGWGRAAFDPSMMVALLLYCYCIGERSSRKIEVRCREDVACRVITANHIPDHTTISRFRQDSESELSQLFVEGLKLCAEAGLVKVGVVALDGTRVRANASLGANRTAGTIDKEVHEILQEARDTDAREDRLFGESRNSKQLPEELAEPASRLSRLAEAKARLDREAAEHQDAYQ
ncbi:hypothetical protein BH23ACT11_BH23ACT11_26610 [soil metagenome]